MKILPVVFTILLSALSLAAADKSEKGNFGGQEKLNNAIKQLSEAQKSAATDSKGAADHLRKASGLLVHTRKDKGSFRATAIRLTDQAVNHLEKGDQATALHEINEALEAANKAGVQGDK
jgi:hypothetical protein